MSSRTEIISQQLQWADAQGLKPDSRGYLRRVQDNLFQKLSEGARRAFELGSGNELSDTASRPAKMKALHSSSALAVNFFDYWSDRDRRTLTRALSLPSNVQLIRFEAQYPTGLSGSPPNIDVELCLENGSVVGIESKFTEWLNRKSESKCPLKEKYFEGRPPLWFSAKLPGCQSLAESLRDRKIVYSYLDAPQLLKHALGMATVLDGNWSLYYIYFDWPGREAEPHREEIADFKERIGDELSFRAFTYQELAERLNSEPEGEGEYLNYIATRYSVCGV